MFTSSKILIHMPVLTTDKEKYECIDALISNDGLNLLALALRKSSDHGTEYVIPCSLIQFINSDDAVYLNKHSSELSRYHFLISAEKSSAIDGKGVDISGIFYDQSHNKTKFPLGKNCHSMRDAMRFKVDCLDDKLGPIKDIFFHPSSFAIHYYSVNIGWGFGQKWAFVSHDWIEKFDWAQRICYLNITKTNILSGPLHKPVDEISDDMAEGIYNYSQKVTKSKSLSAYDDESAGPVDMQMPTR